MNARRSISLVLATAGLLAACRATQPAVARSAERERHPTLGVEVQAYPAGVIAGPRVEWPISSSDVLGLRVAWNETDRRDFGDHDDEKGGGAGVGIGVRRFLGSDRSGWLLGARVDLWALAIDWRDDPPAAASGDTDVLVLQPMIEGGYRWKLGDSRWYFDLTAGFGFEINVHTQGESVGEGAIGIVGAGLGWEL